MRQVVVFDARDLAAESAFWAGMLGGRVFTDERWHSVFDSEGRWRIGIQLAPNHIPPDWPDGEAQQVHLDLHVSDPLEAHAHAMALGARLLKRRRHQRQRRPSRLRRSSWPSVLHRLGTAERRSGPCIPQQSQRRLIDSTNPHSRRYERTRSRQGRARSSGFSGFRTVASSGRRPVTVSAPWVSDDANR